jgi:hypothetical protein
MRPENRLDQPDKQRDADDHDSDRKKSPLATHKGDVAETCSR